ncbi:MAG: triose-phosphate isomerase [Alphaproteobacteria bacterium]|nr:triose-phosphate isomerase [Alphaproteobacteria bacterium]
MKKLIAGNWKMNGSVRDAEALAREISALAGNDASLAARCDFLVCPPFLHMQAVSRILGESSEIAYGAQDCSAEENGAHTGDISASMLKDLGCAYVILGHSERRADHGETSETVRAKAIKALTHHLIPIICVGETLKQRDAGEEEHIVGAQLRDSVPDLEEGQIIVIAYEPVWAIGTGKTPTSLEIEAMHGFIASALKERFPAHEDIRILYGGSLKPTNAQEILAIQHVDGGLIGGASLQADSFIAIAQAA